MLEPGKYALNTLYDYQKSHISCKTKQSHSSKYQLYGSLAKLNPLQVYVYAAIIGIIYMKYVNNITNTVHDTITYNLTDNMSLVNIIKACATCTLEHV